MAGKPGQRSRKATEVPAKYATDFLTTLDGRVRVARTLRERLASILTDLGGADALSHAQRSLAKRAVHVEGLLEGIEAKLATGEVVDVMPYLAAINTLMGLFTRLGLKRVARDVSPLRELLAKRAPE
jgi:hypothetical protein